MADSVIRSAALPEDAEIAIVEDVWGEPFERLAARYRIHRAPDAWSDPERLADHAGTACVLVVRNRTQVTRDLLERLPHVTVVARAGVGLDNIDLDAADALGVVVVAAAGANATSVAEYALGAAIALVRRAVPLDRATRAGAWHRTPGRELAGGTWGVLGFGATGRAVARLARGLDMRVLAYDPYVTSAGPDVRLAPLEETVREADVISVHLPATPDTEGLVGKELLVGMRPGAVLISAGRGDVVDEDALADALESGHLGGAALDVRASEPPVPGRLERIENVLLTPHIAGITAESQHRIAELLTADVERVLAGEPARHAVTACRQPGRRR